MARRKTNVADQTVNTSVAEVKFADNPRDFALIAAIVDRGWKIPWLGRSYKDRMSMHMDVSATHANGNPLRLRELLDADDFNFAHDMSGICNCLDRSTGKLTKNFRPRFSQRATP